MFLKHIVPILSLLGILSFILWGFISPDSKSISNHMVISDGPVPVTAFVMSKCPDAVFCEDVLHKAISQVSDIVHFDLQFIAKRDSQSSLGTTCMHGESECIGNIQQLCAQHYYPESIFDLVLCQNQDILSIPYNFGECAKKSGIQVEGSLSECINGTMGKSLLSRSILITEHAVVTKSCTVMIGFQKRCVRDGQRWYDCIGGSEADDFVRTICDAYGNRSKPQACH